MYSGFFGIRKHLVTIKASPRSLQNYRTPRHYKWIVMTEVCRVSATPTDCASMMFFTFLFLGSLECSNGIVVVELCESFSVNYTRLIWCHTISVPFSLRLARRESSGRS